MGISDFKGIANMTPEERGELWNKMVNYRGAFLSPTNYPAKPAANASAGNTSFNYGSRIDQATMGPGGAPDTVSNAVLPAPKFAPQAPIKAMTPPAPTSGPTNTAANFAPPSSLQTDPNGYAIVDGKRINYADIGGKSDPLRKGGGIVTSGNNPTFAPPDPNVGLANQDAQDRQANLDASGVGTTQTLGQRFGGIQMGRGPGGIINAVMQSKVAKDDRKRLVGDRNFDLTAENVRTDNALKQEALDLKRELLPSEIEANKAHAGYYKEAADRSKWQTTPEGVKALKGDQAAKDRKELVNKYYDSFKNMKLPAGFEGKHMDLAKKFAMADDPDIDYGIYYNPATPGRMGIGARKSQFEPLLKKYLQMGHPEGDAYARAFGDLQRGGQGGYEDIPALGLTFDRQTKPSDTIPGA